MIIRQAHPREADILTSITKKSKAHWNYSNELLSSWSEDLTISSSYISTSTVFVLEIEGKIIGYYSYYPVAKKILLLDNLFILPNNMGNGYGSQLLLHCIRKVEKSGGGIIRLESDPNAYKFYEKYGFEIVSYKETSVPGRNLPVMEVHIQQAMSD